MTTCRTCEEEKTPDQFYKKHPTRCKKCHNIARKAAPDYKAKRKLTGFQKLAPDTQVIIIEQLASDMSVAAIARVHKIKYSTFKYWKSKGQITLPVAPL
jgi:hypothetical protein